MRSSYDARPALAHSLCPWNINLVEQAAVVEVPLLSFLPAAEELVDGEKLQLRKTIRVFGYDLGQPRTIAVLRADLLPFLRVKEIEICVGDLACAVLGRDSINHADRRFSQDADRRGHNFEFIPAQFIERQKRFVLPREQYIA